MDFGGGFGVGPIPNMPSLDSMPAVSQEVIDFIKQVKPFIKNKLSYYITFLPSPPLPVEKFLLKLFKTKGKNYYLTFVIFFVFLFSLIMYIVENMLDYRTTCKIRKEQLKTSEKCRKDQLDEMDTFLTQNPIPPFSLSILSSSLEELRNGIMSKEFTCQDVLISYCHKAVEVHKKLNCCTEILFKEGLIRAKHLDSLPDDHPTRRDSPLFGIPVSLKDSINVSGVPSSIGLFRWQNDPATESSPIVKRLILAGAIPFVKTNVPQTMMSFESSNPLWGTTLHPFEGLKEWIDVPKVFQLSPGGSSSGEAALVAGGGSPLGFGSDTGGSLRMPASFCGLACLKPSHSSAFLPSSSMRSMGPQPFPMEAVVGPLARSVGDLSFAMKAIGCDNRNGFAFGASSKSNNNKNNNNKNNNTETTKRPLRVGVMEGNGFVDVCSDEIKEALCRIKEKLSLKGEEFEVIPCKIGDLIHNRGTLLRWVSVFWKFVTSDSLCFYSRVLKGKSGAIGILDDKKKNTLSPLAILTKGHYMSTSSFKNSDFPSDSEPVDPTVRPFLLLAQRPVWFIRFFAWLARLFHNDKRLSLFLASVGKLSMQEWKSLVWEKCAINKMVTEQWEMMGLDVLLMPAFPVPLVPVGSFARTSFGASYCFIWNVVDWAAGVIPISLPLSCSPLKKRDSKGFEVLEEEMEYYWDGVKKKLSETEWKHIPSGIQIISPPGTESSLIDAMVEIKKYI